MKAAGYSLKAYRRIFEGVVELVQDADALPRLLCERALRGRAFWIRHCADSPMTYIKKDVFSNLLLGVAGNWQPEHWGLGGEFPSTNRRHDARDVTQGLHTAIKS